MTGERILIVEDERITAMSERLLLEDMGYSVTGIVSTGEQAILAAGEDRPDLALMDITLKGEMDGIVAAHEIRERFAIPVVFVTAHGNEEFLNRAKRSEPFGYIIKPFTKNALSSAIELAVYRHRMETKLRDSEERFHIIADFTHDWEYWIDANGDLIYLSPSCERITGYRAKEFLETPELLETIVHSEDRDKVVRHLRKVHTPNQEGAGMDFRIITRGGEERWINHVCQPVHNETGEYLGRRGSNRDITPRKLAEQRAEHMAGHDALTNLPNRALFMDRLEQALARSRRNDTMVALLYIDLDDFKPVNDTMGHKAGDEVLKGVSERLRSCLREIDTVARIGGDEFTVILTDVANRGAVSKMARKLIAALSKPFPVDGGEAAIGASIGVALCPLHAQEPDDMLFAADNAMYAAKESGKRNYKFASPP